MKKKLVIISATIIIIIMIVAAFLILNRNKNNTPVDTLITFEKAINKNDISEMINCLTPELQKEADEIIKEADKYVDKPVALIVETMPFLSTFFDKDIFPDIDFEILEEDVLDKQAEIRVKIKIGKLRIPVKADFELRKIKRKWYIESVKPDLF